MPRSTRRFAPPLLGILGMLASVTLAGAHGTQDQELMFDPGCTTGVMRATAAPSLPRQEFVPTMANLQSVEVCVTNSVSTSITLNIRSGTAASPGPILATATQANVTPGTKYVDVVLAPALLTTPGTMLVAELTGADFVWRGTCGAVVMPDCPSADPDLYAAGVTNAGPLVGDFGFRSYSTDPDNDGFQDAVDNCPSASNPTQLNSDRDFIELGGFGKSYDDLTWPNHDAAGDACDPDDDNDSLTDADELAPATNCPSASAPTNPIERDSDGDRAMDGIECVLGKDPASAASKPTNAECGASTDGDGDGMLTFREVCFYNTNPFVADTDGDLCSDGRESASINADRVVNVIDLQQVGTATMSYIVHFDYTRDGVVNVVDLQQVAARAGSCP